MRIRLCLAAALAIASPAAAQEAAPPADEEIVITGRPVEEQIRGFVDAFTNIHGQRQLSRFEWSVCPAALGLNPAAAGAVVARMRRVAKEAEVPVGKVGCTANVIVMVTQDKKALLEVIQRKYPQFLGDMPNSEIRKLARAPGPAAAWRVEGPPLDADGVEIPQEGGAGGGVRVNRTVRNPSRITPAARPHLIGAVVIIEKGALDGLTTTQVADYAAMRAFAPTDPAKLPPSSPPTILTVLEAPMGTAVPLTMTTWDLAFLKGLYGSPAGLYAGAQRSEIRKEMLGELQRSQEKNER
jgi:hypothetical protein